MADRGDTHYRVSTLNAWFLFSGLLLLGATVWMMFDDWNAPWKAYQRAARSLEVAKAEQGLAALEREGAVAREKELQETVAGATRSLEGHRARLDEVEARLKQVGAESYVKEQAAKFAKADYDWARFNIEEHRAAAADPQASEAELAAALERVNRTALDKEQAAIALKAAQDAVDDVRRDVIEADKRLAAGTSELERQRKRLDLLAPQAKDVQVANVLRDVPGLDFIGPSLKVSKVVLDNLTFELNFTKKTRIDMCMTCHVPIDKAGWEGDEQPLATHPRLDLFLTAKSPHPLKDVGCTICHRGSGEALDFVRADHRPADHAQEEEWKERYHWHKQHHWDYPMLAKDEVEASCVQCHKTSMELIADEAPHVTEGYRLFERYGCYACHKVDWIPTSRRPGPSLKNIQAKIRADARESFLHAWIADPKAFRPTTWMPKFFHLENFPEDEAVVASKYGEGPPILGRQWNETSIAAITAFLEARAPLHPLGPIPVEGDAFRGREVFRVSGCLACHNLAPFEGEEPATRDLAFERNGTNEHGPDLRGVATKVDASWLYHWIKDPKAMWPGTRMPNLRLSDQDAADITAYVMDDPDEVFHDVPEGWSPKVSPVDAAALAEQARWFFSKLGRGEIERRLQGGDPENRWDDTATLEVAVGEQLVRHHGCYSCHEISGLETEMPIGTELTNWGSKTVDKLDFGFAYQMELGGRPKLDHEYREGWLERKLHAPRSFDLSKIKNPKEKLRMPWFDFTDEQVKSIETFVVGLVDDEVQLARMVPDPEDLAMDKGLRAIRQKNCVACHVLEPGQVRFKDGDGHDHEVHAELLALEGSAMPPSMESLAALEKDLARIEEQTEEDVEELSFRLLDNAPDVGGAGDTVFVERSALIGVRPPWGGHFVRTVSDYYLYGIEQFDSEKEEDEAYSYVTADPDGEGRVEDVDGELRSYAEEPYEKVRWTFAPPVLIDEGFKLQREWFYSFLSDPVRLREQMRVRMPTFHFDAGEAEAIADYFANHSARSWPSLYARTLRLTLGLEIEQTYADRYADTPPDERPSFLQHPTWPATELYGGGVGVPLEELAKAIGVTAETLSAIEAGSRPETEGSFDKVRSHGDHVGFRMHAPVRPGYERIERRSPSYLAARESELPGGAHPATLGESVAVRGPNCFQCHFHGGQPPDQKDTPIAWAPDLSRVRERLREDWTKDWLFGPGLVYPGTSMPANFLADPPEYQQIYADSTNDQQIEAVLDWLYNFDRTPPAVTRSMSPR